MEHQADYAKNYSAVFRALHSLKGASGMLGLEELRSHVHQLENIFHQYKEDKKLTPQVVTFFLNGLDAAHLLLLGKQVEFKFDIKINQAPPVPREKNLKQINLKKN